MQTLLYFSKKKHLQGGFFIFHYNQVPQLFLTFSELIYYKAEEGVVKCHRQRFRPFQ
jgi:hypothetical protein